MNEYLVEILITIGAAIGLLNNWYRMKAVIRKEFDDRYVTDKQLTKTKDKIYDSARKNRTEITTEFKGCIDAAEKRMCTNNKLKFYDIKEGNRIAVKLEAMKEDLEEHKKRLP